MRTLTLHRDSEHPSVVHVVHPDGDVIATCGSSVGSDPPLDADYTAEMLAQAWVDDQWLQYSPTEWDWRWEPVVPEEDTCPDAFSNPSGPTSGGGAGTNGGT